MGVGPLGAVQEVKITVVGGDRADVALRLRALVHEHGGQLPVIKTPDHGITQVAREDRRPADRRRHLPIHSARARVVRNRPEGQAGVWARTTDKVKVNDDFNEGRTTLRCDVVDVHLEVEEPLHMGPASQVGKMNFDREGRGGEPQQKDEEKK